jgi:hypothetical protein
VCASCRIVGSLARGPLAVGGWGEGGEVRLPSQPRHLFASQGIATEKMGAAVGRTRIYLGIRRMPSGRLQFWSYSRAIVVANLRGRSFSTIRPCPRINSGRRLRPRCLSWTNGPGSMRPLVIPTSLHLRRCATFSFSFLPPPSPFNAVDYR